VTGLEIAEKAQLVVPFRLSPHSLSGSLLHLKIEMCKVESTTRRGPETPKATASTVALWRNFVLEVRESR
jgi:hypothetical protein